MMPSAWLRQIAAVPRRVLVLLVQAYRLLLRPWVGNVCRFEPSCSAYALESLQHHGALRGTALAGWRVLRCHPWCEGGHDPVPGLGDPQAHPAREDGVACLQSQPRLFTRWIAGTPAVSITDIDTAPTRSADSSAEPIRNCS